MLTPQINSTNKEEKKRGEGQKGGRASGQERQLGETSLDLVFVLSLFQGDKDSSKLTAHETALLSFSQLESPVCLQPNYGHII